MKALDTSTPITATEIRLATRATALLMPEAIPACSASTPPSTAAVRGATVAESPTPKTISAGRISVT